MKAKVNILAKPHPYIFFTLVMLRKQEFFNCDEITIGLLPGAASDMHGTLYIQCVCTDELATCVKSANLRTPIRLQITIKRVKYRLLMPRLYHMF